MDPRARGAAFFDVDKTLLPGVSMEMLLVRALLRGRLPGRFAWIPAIVEAIRLAPHGPTLMRKANKAFLSGARPEDVRAWGERVFASDALPRLAADGRGAAWVRRERGEGRAVVLLSGMPDLLMGPFVRYFEPDLGVATPLAVGADGRLTGRRGGAHPYGPVKLAIARDLCARHGWDPAACSAYGDHASDAYLLAWTGHAYAVDPDRGLKRTAVARGWTILERGRGVDTPVTGAVP